MSGRYAVLLFALLFACGTDPSITLSVLPDGSGELTRATDGTVTLEIALCIGGAFLDASGAPVSTRAEVTDVARGGVDAGPGRTQLVLLTERGGTGCEGRRLSGDFSVPATAGETLSLWVAAGGTGQRVERRVAADPAPPEVSNISLATPAPTLPATGGSVHAVVCLALVGGASAVGTRVSFVTVPTTTVFPAAAEAMTVEGDCSSLPGATATASVDLFVPEDVSRIALIATSGGITRSFTLERSP